MTEIEIALQKELSELKGKLLVMGEALEWANRAVCQAIEEDLIPQGETGGQRMFWRNTKTKIATALSTTQPDIQRIRDEIRAEELNQLLDVLESEYDKLPPTPYCNDIHIAKKQALTDVLEVLQSLLPNKKEVE